MKTIFAAAVLPLMAFSMLAMPGCEQTVAHHEETKRNWDGSLSRKETTVREHPDGSRTVEKDNVRVRD